MLIGDDYSALIVYHDMTLHQMVGFPSFRPHNRAGKAVDWVYRGHVRQNVNVNLLLICSVLV